MNEPSVVRVREVAMRLWPAPLQIDARERWRVTLGAAVGILLVAIACRWLAGPEAAAGWLIAPLGASAVLVFALPASPLAQPWAVVAGNTVSALVGIACVRYLPDLTSAAAVSIAAAMVSMLLLRCLHPPGGACALLMVLTQATAWETALFPVLANSLLLVLAGVAYNTLTGRDYPHRQSPLPSGKQPRSRFSDADLDAALTRYNQVLDLSRDDLQALLAQAEAAAYRRNLSELSCGEVMTPDPHAVQFGEPLSSAWRLMRQHGIKALPVVDRARRVVGIVTLADFIRLARLDEHHGLGDRLKAALRPSGTTHGDRAEVVGQVMTRQVRVASQDRALAELLPLFSSSGHHHIPIVDSEQRLVGMLTQTDLVRALHRAVDPG